MLLKTLRCCLLGVISAPMIPDCCDSVGAQEFRTEPIDFSRDIRPILSDNCFHCHGPDQSTRAAGLRLDTKDGLFREQNGVTPVVAGDGDHSELIRRITSTHQSERMPPPHSNRALTPQQIETLQKWVDQGAPWEQHWAFIPPERPELPAVEDGSWPSNAIDHFILAWLERAGLWPSPQAPKETLLRRVMLDLTGLPPTTEEVDNFLADDSVDAYERVVERLLASPRYGERMAWDWLDAARYADSNGYQGDPERTMWPWRDWVVRALNETTPFDEFTIQQLAGDLLPDATPEQIIATGFNRNHMHNGEGGRIPEETRVENVMDRAETTATVWLGLTMTCCRCHDHKYDPLSQQEYYRFYEFFNNTSEAGGGRSGQIAPVAKYLTSEAQARLAELNRKVHEIASEIAVVEEDLLSKKHATDSSSVADRTQVRPEAVLSALRVSAERRSSDQVAELIEYFQTREPGYAAELKTLNQAVQARDRFDGGLPRVMIMDEKNPREVRVLFRGAYDKPIGEVLPPRVPAALPPLPTGVVPDRLTLARWLVDPGHPLTARVVVNRYWQTFFGTGLVKTAEDFGVQGERPSHPELLDWLATEFVRSGWNVKHMHRLIVTSATYRQSSKLTPEMLERDPDNRLLARSPRFRLPSWTIRDQALAMSGLLVERLGGTSVKPYQPPGIWAEATFGKKQYVQDHGPSLYRRSVYTFWRRIVGPTTFFDVSNRQTCTVKMPRTNTPLHALTTLNDVTYVEAARALGERALTEGGQDPKARVTYAFRRATARRPNAVEREILLGRLETLRRQFAQDRPAALRLLQVGESPRNERLDPVEHAAYTALGTLILNLDETLSKQ